MRCKVLIADDHQLMLAAVRMALESATDIEIVGEAQAGDKLLPLVGRTSPDVVLLDLRMPGMDGLRCLELLRERHPTVKAIVLSGNDDPAAVEASLARGAVAFIQKTVDPADLAAVIRQAIAGHVFYAHRTGSPVAAPLAEWDLTPRETEILVALAEGHSNKQMAQEFWLSAQTIKYHLTNIYRKLGVGSRTEAVRHGVRARADRKSCAPHDDRVCLSSGGYRIRRRATGSRQYRREPGPMRDEEAKLAQRLVRAQRLSVDDATRARTDGLCRAVAGFEPGKKMRQQLRRVDFDCHAHRLVTIFGPSRDGCPWPNVGDVVGNAVVRPTRALISACSSRAGIEPQTTAA